MVRTVWTDLDRQGRGMAAIVEFCKTIIKKEMHKDEPDYDKVMGMIDRQIKAGHQQMALTDMVLNVKLLMKLANKKHMDEVIDMKLNEVRNNAKVLG